MRRFLASSFLFLAAILARADLALPANVEHVETFRGVDQYRLKSNGMTILLVPNHASPVFTFMVVYHVGSRNEAPGNTGSAHLLEHMIFNKSTANFGRANGHKTFQEVLFEAGADYSSTNMTTWYDRMNGYSTLPTDKLELAMKIEADRLGRALILDAERQPEMSVVRNEYEIGENNPSNALYKAVVGAAIQAHPYHWDTIGYRSDIEGVSTDKLREHYKAFFHPDNADAILVGDFEPASALALFDREFGGFRKSDQPIPQVITVEPPQEGERRVEVRRPGTVGLVQLGYMRPGALHPDFYPLEVLSAILGSGVNSRLYQALVEDAARDRGVGRQLYAARSLSAPDRGDRGRRQVPRRGRGGDQGGVGEGRGRRCHRRRSPARAEPDRGLGGAQSRRRVRLRLEPRRGGGLDRLEMVSNLCRPDQGGHSVDVQRVAAAYLVPTHATVGWFVPTARSEAAVVAPVTAGAAPLVTPPEPAAVKPSAAKAAVTASFAARTTRRVLANGIVLDVIEDHANPTVALRGLAFAGDCTEPAVARALPDLTARLLQRGTTKRSKETIGALLDGVGATRTYGTNLTDASLQLNGLSRDLPLLLEILGEELAEPAFAADELAKAKAEAKTAYLRLDDSTSARATQRLSELVYPADHPYRAATTAALLASLEAVTLDDVKTFHREHYAGHGLILAVAGDVDTAKVIEWANKSLGRIPAGRRFLPAAERVAPAGAVSREVVTMRGKANMNIVIGSASGLRRTDPDYEAALIGNAAFGQSSLSSRLGRRVRDTEGLSYSLSSRYVYSDALDGLWLANINVAPQNLAKALHSSLDEIAKYGREGITDEEVQVQKNFFAGNFQVGLGSNSGVAAALLTAEKFGFGPAYLDDYPARFRRSRPRR
ncbi:MAG: pitrilysin family protein [Lacunisphaera sp.]